MYRRFYVINALFLLVLVLCWRVQKNAVVVLKTVEKKPLMKYNNADDMIIFMNEIHTLVGAGATEGAMDATNILKPALAQVNSKLSIPQHLVNIRNI